jgi:transcriptional antiterminator RfaH
MNKWYTVHCKPRGELSAAGNLEQQGYIVYLPRILTRRRRDRKWAHQVEPLFPRYLFLRPRDEQQSIAPVRSTPGVSDFVRFGREPAMVAHHLIESLRAQQDPDTGTHIERSRLEPGARVKILDGPFEGLEGIFGMAIGEERALVLLEMLGNWNRLKVSQDLLAVVG